MFRSVSSRRKIGSAPVHLNVYDLTPINGYAYWFGLGVYHSGVQVHDVEYAFGAHEYASTGIFEGEPRQCPGFAFRKSILIGRTDFGPKEVRALMEELSERYTGNTYHLINKNCNHFCNEACARLTGKSIPRWVNRLARFGSLCNCVLPIGLHVAGGRHRVEARIPEVEKRRLRTSSNNFASPSADFRSAGTPGKSGRSSRRGHSASPSPRPFSPALRTPTGSDPGRRKGLS